MLKLHKQRKEITASSEKDKLMKYMCIDVTWRRICVSLYLCE